MVDIKDVRESIGMSQKRLAELAGVAQSNLSAIESGRRPLTDAMEERLLDAMGRPSAVLRERRDDVVRTVTRLGGSNPRVFGSVARREDLPGSDLDLLVHADPDRAWDAASLPRVLSEELGVKVDVVFDGGLKAKHSQILADAVPL